MQFLAQIHITPKEGVNNPEGLAIARALENLGFNSIVDIKSGKYIELTIQNAESIAQAESIVDKMCNQLLSNIVIEQFTFNLQEID
jgi:phosphoribosylformylglycinamidine synthase PurS subunit